MLTHGGGGGDGRVYGRYSDLETAGVVFSRRGQTTNGRSRLSFKTVPDGTAAALVAAKAAAAATRAKATPAVQASAVAATRRRRSIYVSR